MMNASFDRALDVLHEHVQALQQQALANNVPPGEILPQVFAELRDALEELQVAQEELHLQNEELILARQTAEAEHQRYRDLFDGAPDGYLVTDTSGVVQEANAMAATLLGVDRGKLIGKPLALFVVREERRAFRTQLSQLPRQARLQDWEVHLQPRGGRSFPAAVTVIAVRRGKTDVVGFRWLIRDSTERKAAEEQARQAEQQLRCFQEQLRDLATHLQARQEEERRWIAREIHDELAQKLTALKIDTSWLMRRLTKASDAVQERLREMSAVLNALFSSVHRIGTQLRPDILDNLGLTAAIEWQLEDVHKRSGIAYELSLPAEDISLDPERSTAIFRIFQEALTNVLRHAAASSVAVSVVQRADMIVLDVIDNGRGITAAQVEDRHSLGLLSMRERAHLWGGGVAVRGRLGGGTRVSVWIPRSSVEVRGRSA